MKVEDCFLLGQLRKPHGILGEIRAFFDVDDIEAYEETELVYVLTGQKLTPFSVESLRITSPTTAVIKFANIQSRNEAELLTGLEMYLPLTELPPLEEGQFYYHDVIGYTVRDEVLGALGEIKKIVEMPGHDMIEMSYKGKTVLIPIHSDIVLRAEHGEKVLVTKLPEGLLDIYLAPGKTEE